MFKPTRFLLRFSAVARRCAVASLSVAAVACLPIGGGDTASTDKEGRSVTKDDVLAVTTALIATTQLAGVAFDPNDPAQMQKDAAKLAEKVEARAKIAAPCATVTRADKSVTLDFGAGCAPANTGVLLVGKATASVSVANKDGKDTAVLDFQLTGFGTSGRPASGAATIKGTAGTDRWDVEVAANLTAGTAQVTGGVASQLGKITLNGAAFEGVVFDTLPATSVKLEEGKAAVEVTGTALALAKGDCYPSNGKIEFSTAGVKTRLEFSAETKASGKAAWFPPLSKKAEDVQLPGLGWKCK